MPGHQRGRQPLPRRVLAPGHHRLRHDRGQPGLQQVAQQVVLPAGDLLVGLLDRARALAGAHDPDDVTRQPPREREHASVPLLERQVPGQPDDVGVGLGGQDVHRSGPD